MLAADLSSHVHLNLEEMLLGNSTLGFVLETIRVILLYELEVRRLWHGAGVGRQEPPNTLPVSTRRACLPYCCTLMSWADALLRTRSTSKGVGCDAGSTCDEALPRAPSDGELKAGLLRRCTQRPPAIAGLRAAIRSTPPWMSWSLLKTSKFLLLISPC